MMLATRSLSLPRLGSAKRALRLRPSYAARLSPPRWLSSAPFPPASSQDPKHTLAVVGGGLSGLSSAIYFVRALTPEARKTTRIVVLEKENRTGGWCKSVRVSIPGESAANTQDPLLVFETGPRSIRPVGLHGWLAIELAHSLDLTSHIVTVPKSAPSAKNRFIYWPSSLTLLPSSLPTAIVAAFTKPIIMTALPGIFLEPFRRRSPLHSAPGGGDESIDAFFSRRFGKPLAANIISAVIHGIFSGDTRRLSVRAVFPMLWEAEREWRSVIVGTLLGGLWRKLGWAKESSYRTLVDKETAEMEEVKARLAGAKGGKELIKTMEESSVWGFRGGLQRFTDAMRSWLVEQGVEFRVGTDGDVTSTERTKDGWKITTPTSTLHSTHIITSNPSVLPASLRPPPVPSTTVSVVNLAFPSTPALFPPGFGYLIPRTVSTARNPHNALGVIFDSDVMPSLDASSSSPLDLYKVSLLLGGAYWLDGLPNTTPSPPDHATLVGWAMETLRLHFPRETFPDPTHSLSHTHVGCIPQVPVGYFAELRKLGGRLEGESDAPVAVAGGGTGVIGVNGAVKGGWEVGTSFGRQVSRGGVGEVATGVGMWQ